jgi:hypothetical protein
LRQNPLKLSVALSIECLEELKRVASTHTSEGDIATFVQVQALAEHNNKALLLEQEKELQDTYTIDENVDAILMQDRLENGNRIKTKTDARGFNGSLGVTVRVARKINRMIKENENNPELMIQNILEQPWYSGKGLLIRS